MLAIGLAGLSLTSALFNTNRQVAASVGVAVLTTVLAEATLTPGGSGATVQVQLLAFHDAFAASIVFGVLGILFAPGGQVVSATPHLPLSVGLPT